MDTNTLLLIVIAGFAVYVVYLWIRLQTATRPTVIVAPPATNQSGCLVNAVITVLGIAALVLIGLIVLMFVG